MIITNKIIRNNHVPLWEGQRWEKEDLKTLMFVAALTENTAIEDDNLETKVHILALLIRICSIISSVSATLSTLRTFLKMSVLLHKSTKS